MYKQAKWSDSKDTNSSNFYSVVFEKLKTDTIYQNKFYLTQFYNDNYYNNILYTGDYYVTYSEKDSSAEIISVKNWANHLLSLRHNVLFNLFTPLISTTSQFSPFPSTSDYLNKRNVFKYIDKEIVENYHCYHIQYITYPNNSDSSPFKILNSTFDFWINIQDLVPVRYTATTKIIDNVDTLTEYFSYGLKKYHINSLTSNERNKLNIKIIPKFFRTKEFAGIEPDEPLKIKSIAENWELSSIKGADVALSDFKNRIVLIDFFYKSCLPCIKAFPMLERLNQKYKDQGLVVLGIDPIDKNDSSFLKFVSKKGINYTILLDDQKVFKKYRVSDFPTLYLIGRNGEIIYSAVGFEDRLELKLEQLIQENIKNKIE